MCVSLERTIPFEGLVTELAIVSDTGSLPDNRSFILPIFGGTFTGLK